MINMDILINKNRGWRGLAELVITEEGAKDKHVIFSFSQEVWDDLMSGLIVIQDEEHYTVLCIDNLEDLPRGHQRSVLIKNFRAHVTSATAYDKHNWQSESAHIAPHFMAINDFLSNRNNHTISDWNCIGLRVVPTI
jgi:hypothetical protein